MGRPPHPARAMALCCLFKAEFRMDYRGLASFLRARVNRGLIRLMGLDRPPNKTSLVEAFHRLPPSYLRRVKDRLVEPLKGGASRRTPRASEQDATRRG